jgi:hypothetical protein
VSIIIRLILLLGLLAGLIYASFLALTTFVEPEQHEITIKVPPSKFVR